MMKLKKVKAWALGAFAALGIMLGSNVVKAESVPDDKVITGEDSFEATISEDKDWDVVMDHLGYIVKFVPDKSGIYRFDFDTTVTKQDDDYSHIGGYLYDDDLYCLGFVKVENDDERKDDIYVVKDHVYYLFFERMNGRNEYNVKCDIVYCGTFDYKANLCCGYSPVKELNHKDNVKFDEEKMELEINNYHGERFKFTDYGFREYDWDSTTGVDTWHHYTAKDYMKNKACIKVVVKGKNVINSEKDDVSCIWADGGISFEFVGDGTIECVDNTKKGEYLLDEESYSIYSEDSVTVDGPTIKCSTSGARRFIVKSGVIDYYGNYVNANEIRFLGGKVITSNKIQGYENSWLYAKNVYFVGTVFDLSFSNIGSVFSGENIYLYDGNFNIALDPVYGVYYGEKTYDGYSNIFYAYDTVDISGGKVVITYNRRDEKDETPDNRNAYNTIVDGRGNCFVSNLDLTIIADKSMLRNFREIAGAHEDPQIFAIFAKYDKRYQKSFLVDMDTIKITKMTLEEAEQAALANAEKTKNDSNKTKDAVESVKVGSKITDGKLIYNVTKVGSLDGKKAGKVTVVGLKKKSLKKVSIKSVLTVDGVKYKVTAIGKKAFKNGKKLKSIVIGKNVSKISKGAFAGCKNLNSIKIKSKKINKFVKGTFKGLKKSCVIKVPKKKKKVYTKKIKKAGFKGIVK
ncbi:leucine-rich repeat protein [Eubacterium sp.]|uniref:leucine-rich repeat protein n=1 Tax=Eubacterium sp. TaxID=142586 RepID=UPI0025E6EE2B|nr:leucine-rich repeat protein [Eubacterium sp.]MCR5628153.1 leucine-rich repeat domain-containing protein [Eubacterium sp.]